MLRDWGWDAWTSVTRRTRRTMLTVAGVALGIGGLVGISALAESGSAQIIRRFDQFSATEVQVTLPPGWWGRDELSLERSLRAIPGVLAAGTFLDAQTGLDPVSVETLLGRQHNVPLIVASPGGLAAADPNVLEGGLLTTTACALDPRLALVGLGVSRDLGVTPTLGRNVLFVDGQPFVVIGVVTDRSMTARLAGAVVLCPEGARLVGLHLSDRTLLVRTAPGAGQLVARSAPVAVFPEDPGAVVVQVPPDPRLLRDRISQDTKALLVALSLVALAIGGVGIANTMLVAVWERRHEIGVRQALGATGLQIGALFLLEAALVGGVGGLAGTSLGVLASAGLSAVRGWTYVFPPVLLTAPLIGLLLGTVSGIAPALRASRLDPVESLRSL